MVVRASNSLGDEFQITGHLLSLEDGEYYFSVFTDDADGNDEDYLEGGFWLHVPVEPTADDVVGFGAFADGGSPFTVASLISATSATVATYSGKAAGLCDCESGSDETVVPRVFEADAALTVSFGSADTISGGISGFVVDGSNRADTTIHMQSTELTNTAPGGFFTGRTSLESQIATGENLRNWGGEFYGDASSELPGSVGGTFGATDGSETFVGAFGAHHVVAGDADSGNGDTSGVPPTSSTSGILGSGISAPPAATQVAFRTAAEVTPTYQAANSFINNTPTGSVTQTEGDLTARVFPGFFGIEQNREGFAWSLGMGSGFSSTGPSRVSESSDLSEVFQNVEMQVPSDAGQYYLSILTDSNLKDGVFTPSTAGDYTAAGFWLHVPETGSTLDVSFGAFSHGTTPFDYTGGTASAVVDTSATYAGVAVGAYCECAESAVESGNIDLFDANVTLTANFTSNVISGRVTDFQVGGSRLESTIYLQSAQISTATDGGGFFTGETSLTASDDASQADDGNWGGAFYGAVNGASAPASAAGTFGASSDTHSYLGAFGARLEP